MNIRTCKIHISAPPDCCRFLSSPQGDRWDLKWILGRDKSPSLPLLHGYEFLCVFVCGRQERGAKESGVRVISHCIDGDLARIAVSDGWPITLYAPTNHQSPREFSSARLSSAAQSIFIKDGLSLSQQCPNTDLQKHFIKCSVLLSD